MVFRSRLHVPIYEAYGCSSSDDHQRLVLEMIRFNHFFDAYRLCLYSNVDDLFVKISCFDIYFKYFDICGEFKFVWIIEIYFFMDK